MRTPISPTKTGIEFAKQHLSHWPTRVALSVSIVALLLIIWTRLIDVFGTAGFGPHGECLQWLPTLIAVFVGSDTTTGLSYVSISCTLVFFIWKSWKVIPFQWIFLAFGSFIILCGMTHFIDVLTLWVPTYWLEGTVKLLTAFASVTTALAVPLQIPKIFTLINRAATSEEYKRQLGEAREILRSEVKSETLVDMAHSIVQTNKAQRDFVAVVSHEFRTPLTAIQGFSELLSEDDPDLTEEERRQFASNIYTEALRLNRLISSLLDLNRMKSGYVHFECACIDINDIIHTTIAHVDIISQQHTFNLQLNNSSILCNVEADRIEQVVNNILSNAVKYCPEGGEIVVGSRRDGDMCHVWIQDSGIGIPLEALEEIFVPYSRIGTLHYVKGTGLGLSISRQIIQMHGGRIWAENNPEQGACFHFTLPLVRP